MNAPARNLAAVPPATLAQVLEDLGARIEAGTDLFEANLSDTRLALAGDLFGLSRPECTGLAVLAGAALSESFSRAVATRSGEPVLTLDGMMSLLPGLGWESFAPGAVLRSWQLVQLLRAPLLRQCAVTLDERFLNWLQAIPGVDSRLAMLMRPARDEGPILGRYADQVPELLDAVSRNLGQGRAAPALIVGAGDMTRRRMARQIAEAFKMTPLCLGAEALTLAPDQATLTLRLLEREVVLERALPVIDVDVLDRNLVKSLARFTGPVVVLANRLEAGLSLSDGCCVLSLTPPRAEERAQLWHSGLGLTCETAPVQLAEAFALEADEIDAICETLGPRPEADRIPRAWAAARAALTPPPDPLLTPVAPRAGWDDIVLPRGTEATLRAIAAQSRHRALVHREWGFAGATTRGLGVTALFSGPSGTGKTLAAEVIARDLDLSLLRVNLAQVVDKYIGETEKHLDHVFSLAERSGAILLFDEAEALFHQRGEGDSTQERFTSMTVSYLLQRMECYSGLCVLTTNLRSALDDAFMRRIRFVVPFAFPGQAERLRLWQGAFPAAAPCSALDFAGLTRLPAAGGTIRNIALNAAFLAANHGTAIDMGHVLQACELENTKLEQALDLGPLRRRITP